LRRRDGYGWRIVWIWRRWRLKEGKGRCRGNIKSEKKRSVRVGRGHEG